jgi:O-acetyl-ADP-ribose deacetylase (regulator of RNase III)
MKESIIQGDLIKMAKNGDFDVIVHGCNCFCNMGKGIAAQIKKEFPDAYRADTYTERGSKTKLGGLSFVRMKEGLVVVNAYTQYDYRGSEPNIDYTALRSAFKKIKKEFAGRKIGYPKIGAGLAGGDWNVIKEIISEELKGENHTLVVFD